jgi:hypothetical protein
MEGTRATTFDNAAALQTEAHFTCAVYNANSTTPYISATTVNWVTSEWLFSDGKHYWPVSGALDFFAYMPYEEELPGYYVPSYTTARHPQLTCVDLPMTNSGQSGLKEFVYALTTGQDKANQGVSGVTMTFKHPFARITLKLSSTQQPIHINKITLKSLKNNGSCSFDGSTSSWTPSGEACDFVATLDHDYTANQEIDTYIMVPQTFTGDIVVNADWTDWGAQLTHTVSTSLSSITWAAGTSYTYTFTITESDLKVDTQKYTEQW